MKTDRELLKLPARAAGYALLTINGSNPEIYDGEWRKWNPLTDDGDALRLAVKLKIDVVPSYVWEGPWDDGGKLQDPYAATRRAIVRAAAAIGESMP